MSKSAQPIAASMLCVLVVAASAVAQAPVPAPVPKQAAAAPATPPATPPAAPGPDEQVAALEASCAASATARASRHAQTPLFKRLGGEPGIHAITREVVSLHLKNPEIRRYFEGLDPDVVAKHVAQFLISGTGGPQVYQGPDLTTSHRSMKLTNRDFVLAGGDVVQAMKNLKYGPDEIDEVVCSLVSLRPKVVLAQ
jgi:hemoglobin